MSFKNTLLVHFFSATDNALRKQSGAKETKNIWALIALECSKHLSTIINADLKNTQGYGFLGS
jgi:hypothetical protein